MTVKTSDLTGQTIEIAIRPTLIVRRHPDGGWLVAIDRPLTAA
jgi:ketosteroid isomerase-like protein